MKKVIGINLDGELKVFESSDELNEYNDKIAAETIRNGFKTDGYDGKEE